MYYLLGRFLDVQLRSKLQFGTYHGNTTDAIAAASVMRLETWRSCNYLILRLLLSKKDFTSF